MPYFMVTVNSGNAAFVKAYNFFKQQGGLTEPWGKHWKKVRANSIEEARAKAHKVCGDYGCKIGKKLDKVSRSPRPEYFFSKYLAVARLLIWKGPPHYRPKDLKPTARTFEEFSAAKQQAPILITRMGKIFTLSLRFVKC